MTVASLLKQGRERLKSCGIDNYSAEALWIFEAVFECTKEYTVFNAEIEASPDKTKVFLEKIEERASGVPVQYVIGSWDFYGESFFVGSGVLIPRPETEMLVDFALDYLKDKKSRVVFDLCAGSGCIGLSVARLCPDSKVYLIEKSEKAFEYLERNHEKSGCPNAEIICGDIFNGFDYFGLPSPDLILSNPPYIKSSEIESLQHEVRLEPKAALDGGEDGLMFYRAISEKWHCNTVAVECGETQSDSVEEIFSSVFAKTYSVKDFNNIKRIVIGTERIIK